MGILHHKRSFLMRLSSKNYLYTLEEAVLSEWTKRACLLLARARPEEGQAADSVPLDPNPSVAQGQEGRLVVDQYSDPAQPDSKTAAKFYRWR